MEEDMLTRLQAIDINLLTDIVQQDQSCPDFIVTSWRVSRLSDKGIANPDGLFRFDGRGYDPRHLETERRWTIALKILKAPQEEGELTNIWYWKREFLVAQSGLLNDLPAGGLRAPRFYKTSEQDLSAWIWMEFLKENGPPRWQLHRYPAAAYNLGRLNGAYLNGRSLPDYPWLSRDQGISWAQEDPEKYLDNPAAQRLVSAENRPHLLRLWAARQRIFNAYHKLPQVFCHGDTSRRNHLFCMNAAGIEEHVMIDWAWCGIAPVGWDLSMLLFDSVLMCELDPNDLPRVEEQAFQAYMEGLHSMGWQGESQLVRLGYIVSAALFPLLPMPYGVTFWSKADMQPFAMQTFGRGFEDLAQDWGLLTDYLLHLTDELPGLMKKANI